MSDKIVKLNQIKEAHIQSQSWQDRMMFLYATTVKNYLIWFNQIKEAHDIEAPYWQEGIMYLYCYYCQKKL